MAVLSRAMGLDKETPSQSAIVTANYMDRFDDRPVRILVDTMGESTHFLRKEARLIQGDKEKVRAMGTYVRPITAGHSDASYALDPEAVAPWESCIQVPAVPGYSLYNSVDLRLDPESAGWMRGTLGQRAVMKGWIGFKKERAVDLEALTLFADCFPPCVFASRGMVAWVPTIEFSVNVRQLPRSHRIKGIFSSRFISQGLVEEDGQLWDDQGNLLALSRQIAKYSPIK